MNDLALIKKTYGEKMMHLCRTLFPTILEKEGVLYKILVDNFAPSKFLAEDLVSEKIKNNFKDYIYSLFFKQTEVELEEEEEVIKTPKELLSEAGYDLYECKTEEDIQSFRKYYYRNGATPIYKGGQPKPIDGEELCTFNGGRLNTCHVFFAVKKDVNKIKRKDFNNPKRQDLYGTSVISIQFSKGKNNHLSIKNRYNHTVSDPDATFSNDLENIIAGLTDSFEKYYGYNILKPTSKRFEIPGYVRANDGKFYKYNYEINNVYYCTDNIIIDNFEVKRDYESKEKYLILDYFILDLQNKKIILYDKSIGDSFVETVQDINKIEIINNKEKKVKNILLTFNNDNKVSIEVDKNNKIRSYENKNIKTINDNFLRYNNSLHSLHLPSVVKVGSYFLSENRRLLKIDLHNVKEIGNQFLEKSSILSNINLPNVEKIGDNFISYGGLLTDIAFPNLKEIGDGFLKVSKGVTNINLPNVEKIGDDFIRAGAEDGLLNLVFPKLKNIGDHFLEKNPCLESISLPNVRKIGNGFLKSNFSITNVILPNVEKIVDDFISRGGKLMNIVLPKVKKIGCNFLEENGVLKNIEIPIIEEIGAYFLRWRSYSNDLSLPSNIEQHFKSRKREKIFHINNAKKVFLNLSSKIKSYINNIKTISRKV